MSLIRSLLEQIAKIDEDRLKDKKGNLIPNPGMDTIDPVSLSDKETEDQFQKKLDKTVKGEAAEKETSPGGNHGHTHKYTPGRERTETKDGHDHSIIYKNGKVVGIGPGDHDGHKHGV